MRRSRSFALMLFLTSLASTSALAVNAPVFEGSTPETPSLQIELQVPRGCPVPSQPRHVFYIDAIKGKDTNDGSFAHPWQSLSKVLKTGVNDEQYLAPYLNKAGALANEGKTIEINPKSAVHSGDEILLMSGEYGAVVVQGVNSEFITVKAFPGQTPVLSSLAVHGSSKWVFQDLKIQSLSPVLYSKLVTIQTSGFQGPVDSIILDHDQISSIDDSSKWVVADWVVKANGGIFLDGQSLGHCLTISNSLIKNVKTPIAVMSDDTLITHNTLDNFADDGLDYAANNLVITDNYVTNSHNLGDGMHLDCMQGQIGRGVGGVTVYNDILIDSNICQRVSDPNLAFPGNMQGIDAFDMDWSNLTVTNNIILTNDYQGLSFASVHGGLIANNSVFNDGGGAKETWILVGDKTHEGRISDHVTIRNNLSQNLIISATEPTIVAENNVADAIDLYANGKVNYYKKPGIYEGNQLVTDLEENFVTFNTENQIYDLHLKANNTLPKDLGALGAYHQE